MAKFPKPTCLFKKKNSFKTQSYSFYRNMKQRKAANSIISQSGQWLSTTLYVYFQGSAFKIVLNTHL